MQWPSGQVVKWSFKSGGGGGGDAPAEAPAAAPILVKLNLLVFQAMILNSKIRNLGFVQLEMPLLFEGPLSRVVPTMFQKSQHPTRFFILMQQRGQFGSLCVYRYTGAAARA